MELVKITEIKFNEKNPRTISDAKLEKLKKSIQDFPEMLKLRPLVVDENNVVLGGNMRLKALIDLGIQEIPIERIQNFTEEQKQEFIIKDNIGYGEWDWETLETEWDTELLNDWGLDFPEMEVDESDSMNDDFSMRIGEVVYNPGSSNHKVSDLFQRETKFDSDIEKIENQEMREFLKARTYFHSKFDFPKIADYYAYQASSDEKELFERLALVLLDRDQLISNGFSKLVNDLDEKDYE